MTSNTLRIAIAGDLHGSWCEDDQILLSKLRPDAVLFVGDLSDGHLGIINLIKGIDCPTAVILGNHDQGRDQTGETLRKQIRTLGEIHCAWSFREWDFPPVAIVGGRPCSSGGGFRLSGSVQAVFGPLTLEKSVERIVSATEKAPKDWPLVLLAHSGPAGLGSEVNSLCGRDWKTPAIDWGDTDLALAMNQIRKRRVPDLVVFGHMHHALYRGSGYRKSFYKDIWGTSFLNAACVPRRGLDEKGNEVCHFSWIEFVDNKLKYVSHRWFRNDGVLAYEDVLLT